MSITSLKILSSTSQAILEIKVDGFLNLLANPAISGSYEPTSLPDFDGRTEVLPSIYFLEICIVSTITLNSERNQTISQKSINTIRTLSMDAVQKANSGHPGTPIALAPVMYTLWQKYLRFDPADPIWPNRDRFVLSAGHASMLIYSTLHLAGVKQVSADYKILDSLAVSLDEIKRFRQIDSKTPGHPEYRWTSGLETTTGPLGQGLANAVGMAIAERYLASYFNRPGFELFNYRIYSICGDGCMMEGISNEAASLASHLKLSNLCWIYDNNRITIEGCTSLAFSEDVATRFVGLGWNVVRVADANDTDMLERAINTFHHTTDRPTLIIVDSHIAYGVPEKQDHHSAHGEPLGDKAIKAGKINYGCDPEKTFDVQPGVYEHFQELLGKRGATLNAEWKKLFQEYQKAHSELAQQLELMEKRELPQEWDKDIPVYPADPKGKAGRIASAEVLNAIAPRVPWLMGGAADLAPSTKTRLVYKIDGKEAAGDFQAGSYGGRNMHFGIREHAMGAIINGMALSKIRPYGSGFLIFSDYGRASIRLGSIMEIPVLYIFTHDSIGVGEDGPTHQPIEHLASLRAMPGLTILRPCDANEVAESWRIIMKVKHEPVLLILTRQDLPTLDRSKYAPASGVAKGAYILADAPGGKPDIILMATGSEVSLVVEAHEKLLAEGVKSRVVSMPSWELFEHYCAKNPGYREEVFPSKVRTRLAVEMAAAFGWERYTGLDGDILAMRSFGASAPLKALQQKFGFTLDNVLARAKKLLAGGAKS
ncbi:MAG: transketolase [Gemmataceae bacterium]|nr:transketolase [Gemmataceae bacterium]